MSSNREPIYKIVVAGNSGAGKTSAILRFCNHNTRNTNTAPTIGTDFYAKTTIVQSVQVKLQIWDTPGQETYRTLAKQTCRFAKGIALFFDVTKRDSFTDLTNWIDTLKEILPYPDITPIVIFGNKCDLSEFRTVSEKEAREFAEKHNCQYFQTSAETGENIEEAFLKVANLIADYDKNPLQHQSDPKSVDVKETTTNQRNCC